MHARQCAPVCLRFHCRQQHPRDTLRSRRRIHGEAAACRAIAAAHTRCFLDVLRQPLAGMLLEERLALAGQPGAVSSLLEGLLGNLANAVPEDAGGGTRQHINSILLALLAVETAQRATRLAA